MYSSPTFSWLAVFTRYSPSRSCTVLSFVNSDNFTGREGIYFDGRIPVHYETSKMCGWTQHRTYSVEHSICQHECWQHLLWGHSRRHRIHNQRDRLLSVFRTSIQWYVSHSKFWCSTHFKHALINFSNLQYIARSDSQSLRLKFVRDAASE